MIGVFRLESQMLPGNGKIERTGLGSDSKCKEAVNTAFNYLKANGIESVDLLVHRPKTTSSIIRIYRELV